LARLGHLIRSIRAKDPNTLVIDAGDMFQGTPLFTHYHGEVEVNLLNKMGYDIYTIGNHEFDDGADNLAAQLKKARFEIISANLDCSEHPALNELVKPSTIRKINGQQVAFVGAMTPELERLSLSLGGVKVKQADKNWIEPIKQEVQRLSKMGINKIILVTHCGVDLEEQLARALPEADAIIGGHSHTRLDKPIVIEHESGGPTYVVQTGSYGRALGKLDLAFDNKGRLIPKDTKYSLINVTDRIREEPDLKEYIAEKVKPLLPLRNTLVANAEAAFDNRWTRMPWDSSIGNLICDALFEAGKEYGVQISFHNRGGIRGRIEQGPVTLEKVEEILPFDNRLTFATVDGECIRRVLEHSVNAGLGGHFLDVHGVKFAYDPSRARGGRVIFALAEEESGRWRPLERRKDYKIAVNSYTFQSGEGFDFHGAKDIRNFKERISIPFKQYLMQHKTVKPEPPSRIVPVSSTLTVRPAKNSPSIFIKGAEPNSRLTIVKGSGLGVEPIFDSIPVPLANAKVIASGLLANEIGALKFRSNALRNSGAEQATSEAAKNGSEYVCVIAHPPKNAKNKKVLISYPIEIAAGRESVADSDRASGAAVEAAKEPRHDAVKEPVPSR
ncbi:MAG TPA: 5'-nucleotidase C-terminal domain-containing protein, partial [Candidatus Obscuribacterales bacterium]